MEEIWKYTKPFGWPLKGANGCIGYGFRSIKRKPRQKCKKRKVYRDLRTYGFDTSECWDLYTVIMEFLSDIVGGFFRECGNSDDWYLYDLEGNEYPKGLRAPEELKPFIDADNARHDSYKQHLEEYLSSGDYSKFVDFVIPRLIYYTKHHSGYPGDFSSDEEWTEILKTMVEDLSKCDTKLFIKYFFNLWDQSLLQL